jgi:hypothetical protein
MMNKSRWMMIALMMLSTVAVADYVPFIGSNNNTNAPDGALGGTAGWPGGILPSGSSTGLVTATGNTWCGSYWNNLAIRQTGGTIKLAMTLRGGLSGSGITTIYELEDPRTNYSDYVNANLTSITMWSEKGEGILINLINGHIAVSGDTTFLSSPVIVNVKDGLFATGKATLQKGRLNMVAGGNGEFVVGQMSTSELKTEFNFESGNSGSITIDKIYDGTDFGLSYWNYMAQTGMLLVDGVAVSDLSLFELSNSDKTISLIQVSPEQVGYLAWAADFGLTDTNGSAALTFDVDSDGLDNLAEYALGGNPTVADADTVNPVLSGPVNSAGTNCMTYIYRRRLDAASRGLEYGLVLNAGGLTSPSAWTSAGTEYETGAGAMDASFELVTNACPTDADLLFINLEISQTF